MKYAHVNASFKSTFNSSITISVEMSDENGGCTIKEWQSVLLNNLAPYITNLSHDWYISYFMVMEPIYGTYSVEEILN